MEEECTCINEEVCHICYERNKYCFLCNETYKSYLDPFTVVINSETFVDITHTLCLKCVRSFVKCMQCDRELDEPWDTVYFNVETKEYSCGCCFNDSRNRNYKKCGLGSCNNCTPIKYEVQKHQSNFVDENSLRFELNLPPKLNGKLKRG